MVGHVDHGKTTLVSALSGVWTDRHSEEVKRGISIRLGYADATFRRCPNCPEPSCYTVKEKCEVCGAKTKEVRTVSFVDSPGHETLMATMLSGAAIMNGAILVIAASEPCPRPQTKEHLMALDVIGVKNIVIVQNKIDLVTREEAIEHYEQIKKFIAGTIAENAPIIPISAQHNANLDVLIQTIEKVIPTPEVKEEGGAQMFIARSFDVNKPGTPYSKIQGGVIGGTLSRGTLRPKEKIEIRPGISVEREGRSEWVPLKSVITEIQTGGKKIKEATPGGLIAVGTKLDPFLTKGDALVGQVAGTPGTLPPVWKSFTMSVRLLDRVVGSDDEAAVEPLRSNEPLMLSIGTMTTVGIVKSARGAEAEVILKRPVCAEVGAPVAISRRIGTRWRLIGAGVILK
ncbi:MAG: translation initiation factor IF-2 subunit gamma [Candidatus Syntrophoarchaeum butanivorans]|uniref:Translation initiation factor 2 subunit gamma n=1 Tax=Candidatus Syntropharchaeum butanivorans TaxID=1839936 RepID=A0A1F2P5T3_9EURY|nr:MAG: translation initiation factor IF-2 subunit gamma [Candidatus Syntrophoarchaeum butanivorans]